ncbi:hypothetical protein FAH67_10285 [Neisseria flavescens]|uniref:Uncharacterized protein n=2 Tax=Neisseria TaxID=482 RepID=D4DVI9_NEIEG|nr:hypothetical protein NELON_00650 [Neisseria elongata subsp. glycolytica ATCC 29315]EEG33025.1 hypothetical protein NEIFLAOT_01922 [Neisseria flavescens NRL30031/H210]EFE48119.1 hypothetical protein NEIELOOT_03106 [Neisseria elongata subsp. glycolytica ATCC 29315]QCL69756.1 hypothetical protein FAH67_10285 [Neisseria flavescens]
MTYNFMRPRDMLKMSYTQTITIKDENMTIIIIHFLWIALSWLAASFQAYLDLDSLLKSLFAQTKQAL